jgi:hypothetical protein
MRLAPASASRAILAAALLAVAYLPTITVLALPASAVACVGCPAPTSNPGWAPGVQTRWQYQLQGVSTFASTGGINVNICQVPFTGGSCVKPAAFDIDVYVDQAVSGNNNTLNTAAVNAIHANGAKAICYVEAGGWENFRPDAQTYVNYDNSCAGCLLGNTIGGYANERWVNIKQVAWLTQPGGVLDSRVARCAQAGFDGVEWDLQANYQENTGFSVTANDQMVFNSTIANLAHSHGMSVALKNDPAQAVDLAPWFDYTVNEQCHQYSECGNLKIGFVNAGKAVFNVEYKKTTGTFCPKANGSTENFNSIKKTATLKDVPYTPCR